MQRINLLGLTLAICLSASAFAGAGSSNQLNCSDPTLPQMDMDTCAAQSAQVSDAKLNKTYVTIRLAMIKAGDKADDGALVTAEKAWITFRDLNCEAETRSYQDGSIYPELVSTCLDQMTSARTADLTAAYPEYLGLQ